MGTYDTFKTDPLLEENGAWITVTDGSRWKVRRMNSAKGRAAYDKAQRPYAGIIRRAAASNKMIPVDLDRKIVRDTLMNGIVVAWEDVTGEDGNPLTFNPTNIEKLLTDLPDLAAEVLQRAGELDSFKSELQQEAAKNSDAG